MRRLRSTFTVIALSIRPTARPGTFGVTCGPSKKMCGQDPNKRQRGTYRQKGPHRLGGMYRSTPIGNYIVFKFCGMKGQVLRRTHQSLFPRGEESLYHFGHIRSDTLTHEVLHIYIYIHVLGNEGPHVSTFSVSLAQPALWQK